MNANDIKLALHPMPSSLDREAFIGAYGGIYESSHWVAEEIWPHAGKGALDELSSIQAAMCKTVDNASADRQLALIRAHPELAGRAAIAGVLTAASTSEQSGAGLDQSTPDEFAAFNSLNAQYNKIFGFPFIIAVKGHNRQSILTAFRQRLNNTHDDELAQALTEIHKIAGIRLSSMIRQKEDR